MATVIWGSASGASVVLPWQGNCTLDGTRILGAGQPDDDIALAFNEYVPDATTIALWPMNEPSWSGAAGEVADATGNGHDATAYGAATTDAEWLDRFGLMPTADGSDYWLAPPSSVWSLQELFLAGWARFDAQATSYGAHPRILVVGDWNGTAAPACLALGGYTLDMVVEAAVRDTAGGTTVYVTGGALTFGAWTHIAVWLKAGTLYLYQDGALVGTTTGVGAISWTGSERAFSGVAHYTGGTLYGRFVGAVDDLLVATTNPWGGEFSPHRYEAGSVVARYGLSQPMRLTAIDWAGTFGASYGQVRALYVYTGGGWVQVGGAYPAPPVTGLQYTVAGPDLVKVELEPRQDALQTETPILDWLAVTLEPVETVPTRRRIAAELTRTRIEASAGHRIAADLPRQRIDARSV